MAPSILEAQNGRLLAALKLFQDVLANILETGIVR